MTEAIQLYDRVARQLVTENVFSAGAMRFLYGTTLGLIVESLLVRHRWFSKIYGWRQRRSSSVSQIADFIHQHKIDVTELKRSLPDFKNFNEFFVRELKAGARPLPEDPGLLVSPADARLLVLPVRDGLVVPVKGREYSLASLLRDERLAERYHDGFCLVFRLAPSDHHRFIHIDHGMQSATRKINGALRSVSPLAIRAMLEIFARNAREVSTVETVHFGLVAQVDVGALAVGRIIQHNRHAGAVQRGSERGYFEFGGSTIILLFQAGRMELDSDISIQSDRGIETIVRQGERIARALPQTSNSLIP
jgi:phosphatidylserine decarboxylase